MHQPIRVNRRPKTASRTTTDCNIRTKKSFFLKHIPCYIEPEVPSLSSLANSYELQLLPTLFATTTMEQRQTHEATRDSAAVQVDTEKYVRDPVNQESDQSPRDLHGWKVSGRGSFDLMLLTLHSGLCLTRRCSQQRSYSHSTIPS